MPNFGPVHQRGPKSRGSPQKVCLRLRGHCYPHPSRDLASAGVLYHHGVASGCHGEKCYPVPGSHEISLPTLSPSDGCVWECRALPRGRMAPSQVGDGPSACPLPSPFPGESPVASQPTCGHGSGSQGRPAAGGEPREGLCWVAPTRDAERRPGFMARSSGEQSLPLRHSSHAAGERKPEPSWLPAACLAFPAAALATASDGGVRSRPRRLAGHPHAGTL